MTTTIALRTAAIALLALFAFGVADAPIASAGDGENPNCQQILIVWPGGAAYIVQCLPRPAVS